MKKRPILFNGEMVKAILEGRQTQTRRIVKNIQVKGYSIIHLCPYGQVGDRLWVRETWRCFGGREYEYQHHQTSIRYKADNDFMDARDYEWRPSIHMPRWASRINLEITNVMVERLNDISEEDAMYEGIEQSEEILNANSNDYQWRDYSRPSGCTVQCAELSFKTLWESINGKGSWDKNPWVWIIEFKKV